MRRLLFAVPIVLLPNALHVSVSTGIPGLNFSNLLLLLLLAVLLVSPREPVPALNRAGYLTPPLLALFGALVLGFVIAWMNGPPDTMADLTRLKNAIFYPLLYFVYRRSRLDAPATRQLIMLVLVVAVAAGIEAVWQGLSFGLGEFDDERRATGPFGEATMANRAGVFYAMFLPMLAAVAALFVQRRAVRVAALGGCVILAAAIMLTYSRQSYLIALIGLLMLLMHMMRRSFLAAAVVGVLLLFSVNLFPDSVVQRVQETRQVDATGSAGLDESAASRFDIWSGGIAMWGDHPAGVGLGRFSTHIGYYSDYPGMDAHNAFLLLLAECGPLGLAALIWLLWRLLILGRDLSRSAAPPDVEGRALALGFNISVVSMALSNIYGSPFFEGLVMANFWILCGLLERRAVLDAHAAETIAEVGRRPLPVVARFPLAARAMPGAARLPGGSRQ